MTKSDKEQKERFDQFLYKAHCAGASITTYDAEAFTDKNFPEELKSLNYDKDVCVVENDGYTWTGKAMFEPNGTWYGPDGHISFDAPTILVGTPRAAVRIAPQSIKTLYVAAVKDKTKDAPGMER